MKAAVKKKAQVDADLVETFDCDQRSDEWRSLRAGIITASVMSSVMAEGKDGGASKMRQKLLYQFAGEILSGEPQETFSSSAMDRGREMEAAAIEHYAFLRVVEVERVGFVRRTLRNSFGSDRVVGCSPDGLIGSDGIIEIKTMRPDLMVELADSGRFPTEHKWQAHASLWVTGRAWVDLKIFYTGMPISPTFRIERSETLIAEMRAQVERFYFDLNNIIARVRAKGGMR